MIQKEELSLKEAVRSVIHWIRERRPGQAALDWTVGNSDRPIVLELNFPTLRFNDEEDRFLPVEEQVFHMNGTTPPTFRSLLEAQQRINDIGGEFSLNRSPEDGLVVRVAIPASENDPEDAVEKINLIDREIKKEFQSEFENGV